MKKECTADPWLRRGVRIRGSGVLLCKGAGSTVHLTPDADFPLINIEKGFKGEFSADFPAEDAKAYVVSFTSGDKVNVVPARATLVVAGVEAAVVEEAAARVTAQTNVAFIKRVRRMAW